MTLTPKHILSGIALLLGICGLIWPNNMITAVAVVLLAIVNFIP